MKKGTAKYADPPKNLQDKRITTVGKFLRKTSLDELPQLINVFLGDMSMVGPRPEMPQKVARYSAWQKKRLEVKPGLTGLWQILGRKDLPLEHNLEYDFYYINNQSFLLDLIIILKTIPLVISGKGAY
jgi:lipopolysaccharide/colanic/teichoic acid biosynthesis glycosyltransferase